jgi:hypothetical protein
VVCVVVAGPLAVCPAVCSCEADGIVNCAGRGLADFGALAFDPVGPLHFYGEHNLFTTIPADVFGPTNSTLVVFRAQGCQLRSIHLHAFRHLPALQGLMLINNYLTEIVDGTLAYTPQLQFIMLGGNDLAIIPQLPPAAVFQKLNLNDNLRLVPTRARLAPVAAVLARLELSGTAVASAAPDFLADCRALNTLDVSQNSLPNVRDWSVAAADAGALRSIVLFVRWRIAHPRLETAVKWLAGR